MFFMKNDVIPIVPSLEELRRKYKKDLRSIDERRPSKFRVHAGISLKGSDIRKRLNNKSLSPSLEGSSFSEEKRIAEIFGMNKTDLARSYVNDRQGIRELENKANEYQGRIRKESERKRDEEIRAKAKAEAIAELAKAKNNG